MTDRRRRLLVLLAALVPLGLGTKLYSGPGDGWVRAHAGGFLYVVFFSLLVMAIRPRLSAWLAASLVLAATSALELLQLWHPPLLEAARATWLGRALIGSSFSPGDFLWYAAGALVSVAIVRGLGGPLRTGSDGG